MLREITDLSEVDFNLLITAGKWFRDNDATGLTARQVPIEGLDSKWLNTARHLVRLLSANDDLGLVQRPRTTNFTYLDTAHLRSGGRRYDSVTQGDASRPSYTPTTIIITENKDTALYFLDIEGGIAIQGGGAAGPATISKIPWVIECSNVLYWGDLDAEGYEIVDQYRRRGLNVRTILMDQRPCRNTAGSASLTTPKDEPC